MPSNYYFKLLYLFSLSDIAEETKMMRLCKHQNLLTSITSFVVKTNLWVIMPLVNKGSCLRIMRYLKSINRGEGFKEEWIAIMLKATLEGLKYFHSMNRVHRDIKAGNLLIQNDGTVLISDFGVAAFVKQPGDRTGDRRTFVGTPCWMAPEVMEQSQAYDEKADIWSVGITALELAKGYAPYARLNPMSVLIKTIREDPPSLKTYDVDENGNPVEDNGQKFSKSFKEFIAMCLQKNPKLRQSATALLSKNFITRAKDKSLLVRDLLEGIPIPDTREVVEQKEEPKSAVKKFLAQANKGSYMPGSTWDFTHEEKPRTKKRINFAENNMSIGNLK